MESPPSQLLLRIVTADPGRFGGKAERQLRGWHELNAEPGENLPAALARRGLLMPTALRTLDLLRKGFLTEPDPSLIFTPEGLQVLAASHALEAAPPGRAPAPAALPSRPLLMPPDPPTRPIADARTRPELDLPPVAGRPERSPSPPPYDNAEPPGVPKPGDTLGKCLITAHLGKGGHGMVFTALHQTLNIPVAVKVLLAGGRRADAALRRQLRHEAQVLARLNHPNVTRVLDFDDGEIPYVVMEFVEGPSLADLIAQTGDLRPQRAVEIFRQCALGLQAGWEQGIVHRDIKPGNILLTRSGQAKIADLGLALSAGGAVKPADANAPLVGTCAYMAPEQARTAHEVDFRADIYSLGATFYHTVTGRLPFLARGPRELLIKHATEPVVPPHALDPLRIDRGTSDVIVRMMAKNPADRYASYAELLAALAAVPDAPGSPPKLPPPSVGPADVQTHRDSSIWGRLFTNRKPPTE